MDILDELNSGQPEADEATPTVEAPVETAAAQEEKPETEAQKQQRERDDKGRFKAREDQDQTMVPLTALHETRDKVRALEAELVKLRPAQQAPQPVAPPDIFENPEGYAAYIQNQITTTALNDRLNLSEEMVRQSAGDDVVNAAQEWGKQQLAANPALAQQFYQQRNPYGFLVTEYKRQQSMAQLGDADPAQIDEFIKWRAGQQAPPAQTSTPAIPSSLASAQSARGAVTGHQPPSLDEILRG